jgi:ABC-type Na+ efflux pump permease subunit
MSAFTTLLRKELLDVVRDRRTLLWTVLLPIFVYPGLLMAVGGVVAAGKERLKNEPLTVVVASDEAARFLAGSPVPPKTTYVRGPRAEAEPQLKEKHIAAIVDCVPGAWAAMERGEQAVVQVLYTKRYDTSMEALERLKPVLTAANDGQLHGRLEARNLEPTFATPVRTDAVDLDFQKDLGPLVASRMLPILLLTMLVVGSLQPSVDLTAGEKERGTFETLLVAAVRPIEVMGAKYVTVSLVATFSALMNLASLAGLFTAGLTLDEGQTLQFHFGVGQLALIATCLVLAAFALSGLSLAVASVARTFKEGQTVMTPVVLLGTMPGILAQMPGVELTWVTALVPVLNVGLLVKAVILQTLTPLTVGLTLLTTVLFGAFTLFLATNAFESEALRFGVAGAWRDLFRRRSLDKTEQKQRVG